MCKLFLKNQELKTFMRNHIAEKLYNCLLSARASQIILS